MAIRSFLAFELPEEIKRVVTEISGEARKLPIQVRWVKVSSIHLTVVFMGDVEEADLPGIQEVVGQVCHGYAPFSLAVNGMGIFGPVRNPRVLWIGLEGHVDRMARFRHALHAGLKPLGIREEKRPFRPHLTLGRFRKGPNPGTVIDRFLSRYQDLSSPECSLEKLVLFRSQLGPGGAIYHKLHSWPLTGAR